jgi:hypothetical protein
MQSIRMIQLLNRTETAAGGFQIGESTDVLLEGNRVHATPGTSVGLNSTASPFQISKGALGCISRNNIHD